jgi:hypothetical protein
MDNKNPSIDVYPVVFMVEKALSTHITYDVIRHCWRHCGLYNLSNFDDGDSQA